MVSDGVVDVSDDKWLQDLLAGWLGEDPNVLVSLVLRECYQRRHGDDNQRDAPGGQLPLRLPGRGTGRGRRLRRIAGAGVP